MKYKISHEGNCFEFVFEDDEQDGFFGLKVGDSWQFIGVVAMSDGFEFLFQTPDGRTFIITIPSGEPGTSFAQYLFQTCEPHKAVAISEIVLNPSKDETIVRVVGAWCKGCGSPLIEPVRVRYRTCHPCSLKCQHVFSGGKHSKLLIERSSVKKIAFCVNCGALSSLMPVDQVDMFSFAPTILT